MASIGNLPQESSGICSQMEELKALVLKDPFQAIKLLPSALDQLKKILDEQFRADKWIKQADRALREARSA